MDNKKVAVFIDAENISFEHAERVLKDAAGYGDVIIKRIFADWSSPQMQSWKDKIKLLSLKPEQQFSVIKGKNSSDMSLIVSALIALFERNIDVFCLVSSDSDYTRLVQELREREKTVIGFGMKQTAPAFANSFSEFLYLDKDEKQSGGIDKEKLNALRDIIENLLEQHGKALYGTIGTEIKNKFADFVPKNYGYRSMSELLRANLKHIGNYQTTTESDGTTLSLIRVK